MTVIVGYVPTPEGDAAIEAAIAEAKRRATPLIIINTSNGASRVDPHLLAADQLPALQHRVAENGVEVTIQQPIRGRETVDELIGAATEHQANLIVIGLRRRTQIGKFLLGSTAQRVLIDAPCPVLAVKAQQNA